MKLFNIVALAIVIFGMLLLFIPLVGIILGVLFK